MRGTELKWFPKECKKCLGCLAMQEGSTIASCVNCGQAHILKSGKEEPYFSLLEPIKLP